MSDDEKPPPGFRERLSRHPLSGPFVLALAAIVAALIGATPAFFTGRATAPPDVRTQTVTEPSKPVIPNKAPAPESGNTSSTGAAKVRRKTGSKLLTLSRGYSADLDTLDKDWDVGYAETDPRFDLKFTSAGAGELIADGDDSDLAVATGPASLDTCESATGYVGSLAAEEAKPGVRLCAKTSEGRLAFVIIKEVQGGNDRTQILLEVTVWDR